MQTSYISMQYAFQPVCTGLRINKNDKFMFLSGEIEVFFVF